MLYRLYITVKCDTILLNIYNFYEQIKSIIYINPLKLGQNVYNNKVKTVTRGE